MNHRIVFAMLLAALVSGIMLLVTDLPAQHLQIGDDIDGDAEGDSAGYRVAVNADGSVIAVGAPSTHFTGDHLGDVRVYENQAGAWVQIGDDIAGLEEHDWFGRSLGLSADGSVLAIGAPANDGIGSLAGHVRVFENQSGSWVQIGNDIDGEASNDRSGTSISLSADGSVVAIGAPQNDGAATNAGHVRVYENRAGTWTQIGGDIDGEAANDGLGISVSLSADGSVVAAGADYNDGSATDSGHVRVFVRVTDTWTQIGDDIDGEFAYDHSGYSIDLSSDGTVVAIGAFRNWGGTTDAGHVRVYEYQSGDWVQIGDDIDGEAAGDYSGISVSLSGGGTVVLIGAHFNDGTASNAGHARVYRNQSGNWTLVGAAIDGEAADDESGYSVGLSADGTVAAVGAPNNDGTGDGAGHVRVYALDIDMGLIFADGFEAGTTDAWS